ncbi:hypothetical protein [Emticicia sp. SJ17W-69]|uniref:hypothetical protein n=1 Tax=Emticicia sp. SJ17W-69 TaxID=3421657 RepID=UPI003EC0B057
MEPFQNHLSISYHIKKVDKSKYAIEELHSQQIEIKFTEKTTQESIYEDYFFMDGSVKDISKINI